MALHTSVITLLSSDKQYVGRLPSELVFDVDNSTLNEAGLGGTDARQTTGDITTDPVMTIPAGTVITGIRAHSVRNNTGGTTTYILKLGTTALSAGFTGVSSGDVGLAAAGSALMPLVTGLAADTALNCTTIQTSATATVQSQMRICVSLARVTVP